MFDVALLDDNRGDLVPAPIATTRFDAPIPEGVEVIPTTYITWDALWNMCGDEDYYAELIVDRLLAMASYNECGEIHEVQFDCDWTNSTTDIYYSLCEHAEAYLQAMGIELSITVRLHQLDDGIAPKADRGVLMLYNTGAIKDVRTRNSILDIADIKPYLRSAEYPLPLDFAYPTFSWGVKFKDDEFVAIVSNENESPSRNETIRRERATAAEILEVKALVEKFKDNRFVSLVSDPATATLGEGEILREERVSAEEILQAKEWVERALGQSYQCNIIYHLDETELKNYNDNEISEIYSRN